MVERVDPPSFESDISFADDSFVNLGLHITQATVLQLVHIKREVIIPLGTCFGITNDGLCMTAKHVVEEAVAIASSAPSHVSLDADMQGGFGALYLSSEMHPDNPAHVLGGILPAYRVYTINGSDIALVKLTLPTDTRTGNHVRFPAHRLRLSLPGVGEMFVGLGYRNMKWDADPASKSYRIDHKYSATKGEVEELHPGGRDKAMLPYPCFRTSARLDGGMSGGPLLDHAGRVFGVTCSSYGLTDDEHSPISYGSLIAPAMAMTTDVRDPDGTERRAFLWDLVEGGAISADVRGVEITKTISHLTMKLVQGLILNAALDG